MTFKNHTEQKHRRQLTDLMRDGKPAYHAVGGRLVPFKRMLKGAKSHIVTGGVRVHPLR